MVIEWHIGDVIQKIRKRRRLNQTQLAEKVGVNKATIVRAEDGDPKVSRETYMKIAKALGTTIADLEVEAARLALTSSQAEIQRTAFPVAAGQRFLERRVNPDPGRGPQGETRRSTDDRTP